MKTYKLTVFEADGEKILEESIQAEQDDAAIVLGQKLLAEKGYEEKTHRFTSPLGKLILFHR
mgnify:CR=1 FL=1